ncbi:MAG TPA: hypothetical protein VFB89_06290 [Gemmatimonadales bacterium]|nr:hypothetical protein [Gemmatimonadales bacterium]
MLARMVRPVGAPVFDPATLVLSAWWRANYVTPPWGQNASAGTSGGNDPLDEATDYPTSGTAVNGLTPAAFNGSTQFLGTAGAFSTYATDTAYSGWVLMKVTSISTDIAAPSLYDNNNVWSNGPYAGLVLRDSTGTKSATLFHFDGAQQGVSTAIATGAWTLVQWKYDGTNIKIRTNGGSYSSTAAGTLGDLTAPFLVSQAYDGTKSFTGSILEIGLSLGVISDANFDNIKSYVNSRYALAL